MRTHKLIIGNCVDVLKQTKADSVDMCISSPPFWGLRSYGEKAKTWWDSKSDCSHLNRTTVRKPKAGGFSPDSPVGNNSAPELKREDSYSDFCICGAWFGQLGLEPDFDLYVKHIVQIFNEVKRVLKPEGTCWLNLGETYSGGSGIQGVPDDWDSISMNNRDKYPEEPPAKKTRLPSKCMIGIPWRVALGMIDDGWILRNCIIDYKPNAMPASVLDRLTNTYELLFFFVKSKKYYFNLDGIRVTHKGGEPTKFNIRVRDAQLGKIKNVGPGWGATEEEIKNYDEKEMRESIRDKQYRRRDTQYSLVPPVEPQHGYKGKFSGFGNESEKYGSPRARNERKRKEEAEIKGYTEHSASRLITGLHVKDAEEKAHPLGKNPGDCWSINTTPFHGAHFATFSPDLLTIPITAGCPQDGIVMDIFSGSGTTAMAARDLGRNSISIELNP